ncbi:unannotated protein [freshwater metagenome]|uniref:Unannotated protein n=2 Tax=freshwater metagenome TaxID=449393 RepID=A0A6J6UUZ6_9ZZZZ|nr:hypothetical protein [Actinomycetota bacterium]MSX47846.1 hypothetical protein [Actinomycetota bacterium]MSY09100.1 hypothetical protein [Actinomycetota bacterium]MTB16065.1 hypothetical protein [Actinomycetota bacterium]
MAPIEMVIPVLLALGGALLYLAHEDEQELETHRILAKTRSRIVRISDRSNVKNRLMRIGRDNQYENFRIHQVSYSIFGGSLAWVLSFIVKNDFVLATIFGALMAFSIYFLVDKNLTREVAQYRSQVESEFPAIIEMLTLALSAGETPLGAMTRLSTRSDSYLAKEFIIVVADVRRGKAFHVALDDFGRRVDSAVIRRFIDALITAMLRGAPLIEVLQRHAAEARQTQRNFLMDKAGKAETSMMIPVVFLILPVSILFALWPSVTHLNLFAN